MKTTPTADFSFIRYANCWEDPELLVAALKPSPGQRILSICSAGDNALRLIAEGASVVAVDLNPAQIALGELRREAIRAFDRELFCGFVGITNRHDRWELYQSIRQSLSDTSREFWDAKKAELQRGVIHAGKFERYFSLFRRRILSLIHSRSTVQKLLTEKSRDERIAFYEKVWNNRRWKFLFRFFFSRKVMGLLGRDPSFFDQVEGDVAKPIFARTAYALTELDCAKNPYLHYILTGNFGTVVPPYLEPGIYEKVRQSIDNLTFERGTAESAAEKFGPFDGFNLSDIFEYLTPEQCETVYGKLLDSANPGARLAYWNMLAPRSCPQLYSHRVEQVPQGNELFLVDRAFFYSRFIVDEVSL